MTEYLTEQQQLEHFKTWWKKNGLSTVVIFVIALVAGLGWRYWLVHQEIKLARGSSHYESLLNAVVNDNTAVAMKEANLLKQNYVHTPYAALATLMLAKNAVYQHDYKTASHDLSWVIKKGSTPSLREVARLRLAQIDLQQQPQKALSELSKIDDLNYLPLIEETRGDSYVALGDWQNAKMAYQNALKHFGNADTQPLLQMKLDNLASHFSSGE